MEERQVDIDVVKIESHKGGNEVRVGKVIVWDVFISFWGLPLDNSSVW